MTKKLLSLFLILSILSGALPARAGGVPLTPSNGGPFLAQALATAPVFGWRFPAHLFHRLTRGHLAPSPTPEAPEPLHVTEFGDDAHLNDSFEQAAAVLRRTRLLTQGELNTALVGMKSGAVDILPQGVLAADLDKAFGDVENFEGDYLLEQVSRDFRKQFMAYYDIYKAYGAVCKKDEGLEWWHLVPYVVWLEGKLNEKDPKPAYVSPLAPEADIQEWRTVKDQMYPDFLKRQAEAGALKVDEYGNKVLRTPGATGKPSAVIQMCYPTDFTVAWEINAHMDLRKRVNRIRNARQWENAIDVLLKEGVQIILIDQPPALADFVYVANGVQEHPHPEERAVVLPRFANRERQAETLHYVDYYLHRKYQIKDIARRSPWEGPGDLSPYYDENGNLKMVGGYGDPSKGLRSNREAQREIAAFIGKELIPIELRGDWLFHSDTTFCGLGDGYALYHRASWLGRRLARYVSGRDLKQPGRWNDFLRRVLPRYVALGGMTEASEEVIRREVKYPIPIGAKDAANFVANAVVIGRTIIVNEMTWLLRLRLWLEPGIRAAIPILGEFFTHPSAWRASIDQLRRLRSDWPGFNVIQLFLSESMKGGGSIRCLSNRQVWRSGDAEGLRDPTDADWEKWGISEQPRMAPIPQLSETTPQLVTDSWRRFLLGPGVRTAGALALLVASGIIFGWHGLAITTLLLAATLGDSPQEARSSASKNILRRSLKDKDAVVRAAALTALGELGDISVLPVISRCLAHDPDWRVRSAAAHALGRFKNPAAIGALTSALTDRNATEAAPLTMVVRRAAAEALIRMDWHPQEPFVKVFFAAGTKAVVERAFQQACQRYIRTFLDGLEGTRKTPTRDIRDYLKIIQASIREEWGSLADRSPVSTQKAVLRGFMKQIGQPWAFLYAWTLWQVTQNGGGDTGIHPLGHVWSIFKGLPLLDIGHDSNKNRRRYADEQMRRLSIIPLQHPPVLDDEVIPDLVSSSLQKEDQIGHYRNALRLLNAYIQHDEVLDDRKVIRLYMVSQGTGDPYVRSYPVTVDGWVCPEPSVLPALMSAYMTWFMTRDAEISKIANAEDRARAAIAFAAEAQYHFFHIHPFEDGNGRMSHLLMNYILVRNGLRPLTFRARDAQAYRTILRYMPAPRDYPGIDTAYFPAELALFIATQQVDGQAPLRRSARGSLIARFAVSQKTLQQSG